MSFPFRIPDPRVCKVGGLRYQRQIIPVERRRAIPFVTIAVDTRHLDAIPNVLLFMIGPDRRSYSPKLEFMNWPVLRCHLAASIVATDY